MKVSLPNVRIAFADIFEAKAFGDAPEAFSCTFLFPPGHPAEKAVEAAMISAAKDKWGAKGDATYKQLQAGGRVCLQDGDSKDYDGFAGNLFVSARSATRPLVIDRDKSPLIAADGRPYSGCYVNAQVEVWAQDNQFGKRINAQLKGIQFFKDGDAFGGSAPSNPDDFEDLGVEEGELA